MRFIAILFIYLFNSSIAFADWRADVPELIVKESYDRLANAYWADDDSLWIFARNPNLNWGSLVENHFCTVLERAGKPADLEVGISVFSLKGLPDNPEKITRSYCK